jgi:hypothetical protein
MGGACSKNGERRGAYRILMGKLNEELKEMGVYGRIILRYISRNCDAGHG